MDGLGFRLGHDGDIVDHDGRLMRGRDDSVGRATGAAHDGDHVAACRHDGHDFPPVAVSAIEAVDEGIDVIS